MDKTITLLFVAGVALIDLGPFRVYRYLLLSDVLLLAAAALQFKGRWTGRLYAPTFLMVLFGVYLLSTALAFSRSLAPAQGMFTWLHSAFLMSVYVPALTTLLVRRPELRRYAFWALLVSVTVQSVLVVQAVVGGLHWETGSRIGGAFGSAQFTPYAVAAIGAMALSVSGSWLLSAGAVVSFIIIAAAEFFFRARMLWLATIVGLCSFAVMHLRNKLVGVALAALACAACAAGYVLDLFPDAVQTRIAATIRPMESPDLVARMRVAQDMFGAIVGSPLIGLGLGQSPDYLTGLPEAPAIVNVHNIILHAAAEGGVAAAVALLLIPVGILLLWGTARQLHTTGLDRAMVDWACASLLAIYAAAQLTPSLYEHSFYFLIAFLASMAGPREHATAGTARNVH